MADLIRQLRADLACSAGRRAAAQETTAAIATCAVFTFLSFIVLAVGG